MRYIILPIEKAEEFGFAIFGRATNGDVTVLHEAEVMASARLKGGFGERAQSLGGEIVDNGEAISRMFNKEK